MHDLTGSRHVTLSKQSSTRLPGVNIRNTVRDGFTQETGGLPKTMPFEGVTLAGPSDMRNVTQRHPVVGRLAWRRPASIRKSSVPDSCHRNGRMCVVHPEVEGFSSKFSHTIRDRIYKMIGSTTWKVSVETPIDLSHHAFSAAIRTAADPCFSEIVLVRFGRCHIMASSSVQISRSLPSIIFSYCIRKTIKARPQCPARIQRSLMDPVLFLCLSPFRLRLSATGSTPLCPLWDRVFDPDESLVNIFHRGSMDVDRNPGGSTARRENSRGFFGTAKTSMAGEKKHVNMDDASA